MEVVVVIPLLLVSLDVYSTTSERMDPPQLLLQIRHVEQFTVGALISRWPSQIEISWRFDGPAEHHFSGAYSCGFVLSGAVRHHQEWQQAVQSFWFSATNADSICSRVRLKRSTFPSDWGLSGVVRVLSIPNNSHISWKT